MLEKYIQPGIFEGIFFKRLVKIPLMASILLHLMLFSLSASCIIYYYKYYLDLNHGQGG